MSNKIMNHVVSAVKKTKFKVKKHSPEILVVAGVIGTVASAVMACKATTKINDILDDTKDQLGKVHGAASGEIPTTEPYSEEDAKKDTALIYAQTGLKLAKLYAPSVILGALSITSIFASNNILRKRNVALGAAYAAIDASFKEYRGQVVERFGKEVDRQLKYNIKSEKVEETETDENGKKHKVKKTVDIADPNLTSAYAKWFDESNPNWKKDHDYNLFFLKAQQSYANDKLVADGMLFLNDVYDLLGFERTKAGQIVGWIYDPECPIGDNFVDFGIFDTCKKNREFVNGYENTILLDFNCDGNVWEKM